MRATLIVLLFLLLSACAADPNIAYIQGVWVAVIDESAAAPLQLEAEWQFNNGAFIVQQETGPDQWLISSGSYRLVSSEGDVLEIELYDISGDRFTYENGPATYQIEIDRANGTVRINSRTFERAG